MKVRPVFGTMPILLACTSSAALGDATVWTNGNGLGGATLRETGADGVTVTETLAGSGQSGGVKRPDRAPATQEKTPLYLERSVKPLT